MKSRGAHFSTDFQVNLAVFRDGWREREPYPKLSELDRDRVRGASASRNDRIWEFATRQKACFFTRRS